MVKWFRSACFELQRMLYLERWSVFVLVVSPTMLETFSVVCAPFWSEGEALTYFTENGHFFFGCRFCEGVVLAWFVFHLILVSLASIHLENAENGFPSAGGLGFCLPFLEIHAL